MEKITKVAFISLNYLPNTGGLVRYLESLSENLIDSGVRVDIYCSNGKNESLKSI